MLARINPQQQSFLQNYFDPSSQTFGNCYRSALNAGFSHNTAKSMTVKPPKWLQEKVGNSSLDPEQLLSKLTDIINSESTAPRDKIRGIELLMKHHGMLQNNVNIDVEQKLLHISLGQQREKYGFS